MTAHVALQLSLGVTQVKKKYRFKPKKLKSNRTMKSDNHADKYMICRDYGSCYE